MNTVRAIVKWIVESKLDTLRALSNAELSDLPGTSDDMFLDGRAGKLHVYRDYLAGSHRIIVQAYLKSLSGFGAIVIPSGFLIDGNGARRDLREDEMYDFT